MTCCFFASLNALLMPTEPIGAPVDVNVPSLHRWPVLSDP
jgi:hypothetical protein